MTESPTLKFTLPPAGAPDLDDIAQALREFCITVAWLRDPHKGCPWDLKQTHSSLRRYMIEEAYEAAETMTESPSANLKEELGDVLLQVVLNAQVALDRGAFGLGDVIRTINEKMRRRHPHVFAGSSDEREPPSHSDLRQTWEEIKANEKKSESTTTTSLGLFAEAKGKHPATRQAHMIGKIAARIDFDWSTSGEVLSQVIAETQELLEELERPETAIHRIADELGDVYFSLAQLARHLGLDPEVVSLDANRKFLKRFERMETIAAKDGIEIRTAGRDTLEKLWTRAKVEEKAGL